MKKTRVQKGITLIALIITIVVLLILAAVAINSIVGDGILDYAKNAADEYAKKQEEEAKRLQEYLDFLNGNPSVDEGTDGDAVGVMGNDNTITLSGALLTAGSYTLKYENESGIMNDYADICTLEVTESGNNVAYDDFIQENCAPQGAKRIGVYNSAGNRVGSVEFSSTFTPNFGNKLYSFGAISDVHIGYETAESDFQNALTYLTNTEQVDFICSLGDLTTMCNNEELTTYKSIVDNYAGSTPVYAITGNHDTPHYRGSNVSTIIESYTGQPLYYSFTEGNDVFIMMGIEEEDISTLISREQFQWLYETLEENRNKRCFVFQHVRPNNSSGDPYDIISNDLWGGTNEVVFESLLEHYPNVTLFHGHSHLEFALQAISDTANFENASGYNSIHVPSLALPRTGNISGNSSKQDLPDESEGYVVDVYENGILLRGRDFVGEKFLPIAQYYISTNLQSITADTYIDNTGTINAEIVDFNWNYGIHLDSSTGIESENSDYTASEHIVLEDGFTYWVNSNYGNNWNMDVYFYDVNENFISKVNVWSSSNPFSTAVKLNAPSNATSFRFKIWTGGNVDYAVAPTFVTRRGGAQDSDAGQDSEEPQGIINLIDTAGYTDNKRLGTSDGSFRDLDGFTVTGFIKVDAVGDVYRTAGVNFIDDNNLGGIWIYNSDQSYWTYHNLNSASTFDTRIGQVVVDVNGNLTITINVEDSVDKYFRLCGIGSGSSLVVTKNQVIE